MRRVLLLALVIFLQSPAYASAPYIEVNALPQSTRIGGSVTYVATIRADTPAAATLTINTRLSDIALSTIPETSCAIRDAVTSVVALCNVTSNPTTITLSGIVQGGTRKTILFTSEIDGAADQDVQFVAGVRTLYLSMITRGTDETQ